MSASFSFVAAPAPHPARAPAGFLELLPVVERHARVVFRGRPAADRDEAAAEAVAAAYVSYVRLTARGKDPARDFPSTLATYAVYHVRAGRHVGGRVSTTDVLSPQARVRHGYRVEPLDTSSGAAVGNPIVRACDRRCAPLNELLGGNTRTPVPDQAAFRVDFPAFLAGLGGRDRDLAEFLALGHRAHDAAARFGLSAGRISQLRRAWAADWRRTQEAPDVELLPRHE